MKKVFIFLMVLFCLRIVDVYYDGIKQLELTLCRQKLTDIANQTNHIVLTDDSCL